MASSCTYTVAITTSCSPLPIPEISLVSLAVMLTSYDNQDKMKRIANGDTSLLNQHYENKLLELKHKKKSLQSEIEMLRVNLFSISSTPRAGAQKPKEEYLQKLNVLEAKVTELKKNKKHRLSFFDRNKRVMTQQEADKEIFILFKVYRVWLQRWKYLHIQSMVRGCESMIAKGVRFNAEKKQVGNYYCTKIWSFSMKSACCKHLIVIHTDPKNCEYVIMSGARRKVEENDVEDAETMEFPADEERGKLADPFYCLVVFFKDNLERIYYMCLHYYV